MTPILALGAFPLANALLTTKHLDQPDRRYPLDLVLCESCSLVQITETISPAELFSDYTYFSSFSDSMLAHAEYLTNRMIEERKLCSESLVVEIASNDGYLLQYYQSNGIPILGIEPARNIAEVAITERGIPTICEFFDLSLAKRLARDGRCADVVHANNVLAHVPDLNGFVAGLRTLLKDDGIVIVEVPYVKSLIDNVLFDTIYHEHLCYFSLTALTQLFSRHGLPVVDVERLDIHGGSLRIYAVGRSAQSNPQSSSSVAELLDEESEWGAQRIDFYRDFETRVNKLRHDLKTLLTGLRKNNKRVAVYGASAKGSTLMNYFGLGQETLEYVVDRSTVKQGKITPGNHLEIHSPDKLLDDRPDYVLLLTWNFADEILKQQQAYRDAGGRFIIPLPEIKVA